VNDIQLSVFTVATPDLSPSQLANAAKLAGLQGIEWRYQDVPAELKHAPYSFWGNNRCSISTDWDEAHLAAFRDTAQSNGLESIAVVPYLACGDMAGTERVLQAAKRLGASYIRLGVHAYDRNKAFGDLFREQRDYLKEAQTMCRTYGVKGLIETHHGTIAASASAAYRLIEGTDPEWVGVLFDPGNMVHEGYENYRMGMELLGPHLAHVHVKNAGWIVPESTGEDGSGPWSVRWAGLSKGVVDWRQVIADLRAVDYRGWIGIEDFSGEFGSEDLLKNFANYMRNLLG
jgi:sugar phosphate isomerase/epimerase